MFNCRVMLTIDLTDALCVLPLLMGHPPAPLLLLLLLLLFVDPPVDGSESVEEREPEVGLKKGRKLSKQELCLNSV